MCAREKSLTSRYESSRRPVTARAGDGGAAAAGPVDTYERLLDSVPASVLRSFRERLLGPLAEYDTRHGAELLPTLRSFLACDGSWSACASRMYVHVNTVRYRIGRIEAHHRPRPVGPAGPGGLLPRPARRVAPACHRPRRL